MEKTRNNNKSKLWKLQNKMVEEFKILVVIIKL